MHILIILALIALVIIIWTNRGNFVEPTAIDRPQNDSDRYPIAFIDRGKLFFRRPGHEVAEIQSPYVQGLVDRMEKSRQLHGWKEGTAFGVSATGALRRGPGANLEIRAVSAQFASPSRVIYSLWSESFGGLFAQELSDGKEDRLLHKQNLALEDLAISPDGSKLLCSAHARNGCANIAVLNVDGTDYQEVSAGDTVDTHPAWIAGEPDSVLYQSSGIARDPEGFVVAQGPASIHMLNLSNGELEAIREDEGWDFMQPKVAPDGCLYFIRRPYEMQQYGASNLFVDSLLFPFRLLRAVFHYLNFFSLMYSRKPLSSAAGPGVEADLRELVVKGKRFDAEQALRSGKKVCGVPSLVPATWQLVRRTKHGDESVVAGHVASFDVAPDGCLIFSNGFGVFAVDSQVAASPFFQGKLIANVIVGRTGA